MNDVNRIAVVLEKISMGLTIFVHDRIGYLWNSQEEIDTLVKLISLPIKEHNELQKKINGDDKNT